MNIQTVTIKNDPFTLLIKPGDKLYNDKLMPIAEVIDREVRGENIRLVIKLAEAA